MMDELRTGMTNLTVLDSILRDEFQIELGSLFG